MKNTRQNIEICIPEVKWFRIKLRHITNKAFIMLMIDFQIRVLFTEKTCKINKLLSNDYLQS